MDGIKKATQIIEKQEQINVVSDLIIKSRRLLSKIQKLRIELNRAKGWGLGDLFGSGIFTKQSKNSSIRNIDELAREIEQLNNELINDLKTSRLKLSLSPVLKTIDSFLSTTLIEWVVYRKLKKLSAEAEQYEKIVSAHIDSLEEWEIKIDNELIDIKNG